jgi:hypothetical protein
MNQNVLTQNFNIEPTGDKYFNGANQCMYSSHDLQENPFANTKLDKVTTTKG